MMENVPVVIGRYRLSKTLGIGAFGKVKCKYIKEETAEKRRSSSQHNATVMYHYSSVGQFAL